jgi:hypothetical protein
MTKICSRCGANICETCRFRNIQINALLCLDCEANVCDKCLWGVKT